MAEASLEQARALRAEGRLGEAIAMLVSLPASLESRLELADAQHAASILDDAAATLEQLTTPHADEPRVFRLLGRVHLSAGRYADANDAYGRAFALDPEDLASLAGRAEALHRAGGHDAALTLIEPHLSSRHDAVASVFARLARRADRLEEARSLLDAALENDAIPPDRRSAALHARGDVLDALKQYDGAFDSYQQANQLAGASFDADAQERLFQRIRGVYQVGAARVLPKSGHETELAVFIVGMPRSGTSLAEQILASHPSVRAGGERPDIRNIIMSFPRRTAPPTPFPDGARAIPAQTLKQIANAYIAPLHSDGVERITDKTPMNFMAIGLIAQLFPKARIIHCVRHPLDTCLSCYFSNFAGAHPYTRDLVGVARFYAQYRRMMDHWRRASTLDMLDLGYESLVSSQEANTRALIEFTGLPWHDACLRFHETDRPVHTASFDQVRRPMYSSSLARWKRYERHLSPIIDTLRAEGIDPQID